MSNLDVHEARPFVLLCSVSKTESETGGNGLRLSQHQHTRRYFIIKTENSIIPCERHFSFLSFSLLLSPLKQVYERLPSKGHPLMDTRFTKCRSLVGPGSVLAKIGKVTRAEDFSAEMARDGCQRPGDVR